MKRILIISSLLLIPFYAYECAAQGVVDSKSLLQKKDSNKSGGNKDKALLDYDMAVRTAPGQEAEADARYRAAVAYYGENKYDAAIAELNEVIRIQPSAANAYYIRGVSYIDSGRPKEGMPDIDKFISMSPAPAAGYMARGTAYGLLGEFDKAIADLDNSIRLDPAPAIVYAKRAAMYYEKAKISRDISDYGKAIGDYTKCVEIDPKFSPGLVYRWRAASYAAAGDQTAAIADFDRAIEAEPNAADLYCDRGSANFRAGRLDKAKQDYEKSIELDPKGRSGEAARANLSILMNKIGGGSQTAPSLTKEESDKVTAMEQEWAANIDKAVPFIRSKNYPAARIYVDKSRETVENIKKVLASKGYDVSKIDRLVGMEKLVEVYANLSRIGAYAAAPETAAREIDNVKTLLQDTRARINEARAAFHEVPQLQVLCDQIGGIVDGLEGEISKYAR